MHFLVVGSSVVVLSVVSRSSLGVLSVKLGKVQAMGKETEILIKMHFLVVGSSQVVPWFLSRQGLERLFLLWFFLGLLHGVHIQGTREENLNNRTFVVIPTCSCF